MCIPDIILQLHLLTVCEKRRRIRNHLGIKCLRHLVAPDARAIARMRAGVGLRQDRVEVEIIQIIRPAAHLVQQLRTPDNVFERPEPERGQNPAHILGDEGEQIDHLLRRALKFFAQRLILGAHAHGAGVGMALPDHDAAHGHERGRADAELLGAEHGRDHDVPSGFNAAIRAQRHVVAQPVEHQHLMRLRQPHFPRHARIFHARLRGRAGAADMARYQDRIGLRLRHPRRNRADPGTGDQLHAHGRIRVDLLQIINELRQILDRINIMMGRRRDQHHAGCGMAQLRDQFRHLEARQLPAFAGFRTLRDLDLDLLAVIEIFRGDAKPPGGDLLDRGGRVIPVRPRNRARRVLAAFTRIRACADAVHRNRERLMRLRA